MVQQITKNTDADTFRIDGESTRVLGINTAESVAVNEGRNTTEGQISSDRAKVIAPVGTEVTTEGEGKGKFGRNLRDVKIQTTGGEVDYGLVTLDQGMSQYSIDYGTHPDPEQHDIFKEYFSENSPYQYNEVREPLSQEEYNTVAKNIQAYTEAEEAMTSGSITREEYEDKLYTAYGDPKQIARFRYQNMQWQRDFEMSKYDGSDRMAYDWAHQSPENKERYDRAVRNTHTGFRINPEKTPGFWKGMWESTETMFSALNDMAVLGRHQDLENARKFTDDSFDVPDAELLKGVPDQYHSVIMQEAAEYGDDAALQRRDNLLHDLQNAEDMGNMPLATQIATAIPAVLLSPSSVLPGIAIGRGTVTAGRSIDSVMKAGRMRNLAIPSKVMTWAAGGSAEAAVAAVPRLIADDTYSAADMLNEMKWGAAFGVGLGSIATGVSKLRQDKYVVGMNTVLKNVQKETELIAGAPMSFKEYVPPVQPPLAPLKPVGEEVVEEVVDVTKATPEQLRTQATENVANIFKQYTPAKIETNNVLDAVTRSGGGQSFTMTMLKMDNTVGKWVGEHLLELPQGFGGKKVRHASAALQQNSLKTRYLTQTQPDYHKLVGQYASEQGKRKFGKFAAQHMDAGNNRVAQNFSRDVLRVIEARRQGHKLDNTSKAVTAMADSLESSMTKMFDDLVGAGVTGFSRDRRITNYMPQLWNANKMRSAVAQHGAHRVKNILAQGYLASKHNDIYDMNSAMDMAEALYTNVLEDKVGDLAMPATIDSRAKQRVDIDSTVTGSNGLVMFDLLEDDVPTIMAKYTNRAAGQVSLANKGLRGDADVTAMRELMESEGASVSDLQHFDDAIAITMGRPTRDGLDASVREVKDAVAQSKMGGLGMSQLAEAGTVLARTMMQLFDDPQVFKKVWSMAGESTDNKQLMKETQALSGITNEVHLLDRQAVHLDQQAMDEIRGVRKVVASVVQKATFGSLKAPAGYILGQASGFNMIRRFERRLANASFMIDTAKAYKDGTGVMSAARMKDIGLDPDDWQLKDTFRNIVEYDENGIVSKLNIDKWDPEVRERYHLAMYRDDAQVVQQTIGGEMPAWINKPMMTVLAQFKQQAILANNKQLNRNMQFADKEAVLAVTMNMAMAGITRAAKFGTLGAAAYAVTGDESELMELQNPFFDGEDSNVSYMDAEKYVSQFGFFPDIGHMAWDISESLASEDPVTGVANNVAGEIPMLGWMKDYYDIGAADSLNDKADAVKGVMILGNMQFADTIYKGLEAALED